MRDNKTRPDAGTPSRKSTRTTCKYSTAVETAKDGICCFALFGAIPAIMVIVGGGF